MTTGIARAAVLAGVAGAGFACTPANRGGPGDAAVDGVAGDARVDAPIDADVGIRYDVAYVNEIQVSSEITSLRGLVLVVNKSDVPVSVDAITVVSFADDTPGADWVFTKDPGSGVKLLPGNAAGALSPSSIVQLVDSGLVREPIGDSTLNFTISFQFEPPPGLKFQARAVLQLEDKRVTLPFQFHITRTGTVQAITATRVSSTP